MNGIEQFLAKHGSAISTFEYLAVIVAVSFLECIIPRRRSGDALRLRWFGNITIDILGLITTGLIFPVLGFGFALRCAERGWGLLNRISLPLWSEFILTFLILDIAAYGQHYLFHRVPVLWRIHRLHHTDQDVDFSTGVRHHPLETIVSTGFNLTFIAAIGAPPVAVMMAQWVSVIVVFTTHGNFCVPASLDRTLRLFVITPDMHRIHHSVDFQESNSNFGILFPWWDRLFGSYIPQPHAGHEGTVFGLTEFKERRHLMLPWMLAQPFLRATSFEETSQERRAVFSRVD